MDEQAIQQITSTLWAPLVAISTTAGGESNAQIAVSALNASILRERPRVLIEIWKANYTHHLLMESGVFALHLLGEANLPLIERLGLRSGRDGDKLAGLRWETRQTGSPILLETLGYVECRVRGTLDAGDMTCFLFQYPQSGSLAAFIPSPSPKNGIINVYQRVPQRSMLSAKVLACYEEHQARQREVARGLLGG